MGEVKHLIDVVQKGRAEAVAMADVLHYEKLSLEEIRRTSLLAGIRVRTGG